MMDHTLKAKWLADLRSGKFAQGRSMLLNTGNNSYCCLGVLCKTAGAKWQEWDREEEYYSNVPVLDGALIGKDDEELTKQYRRKIGISEHEMKHLIKMNDGEGDAVLAGYVPPKSFSEIADWIEENL